MTVDIVRGDARHLDLPDASVDLIVTSPPYFGLRSYTDGGEHYAEQIGGEATPKEYVTALLACTREWSRVLKPGGSMFVNLGDKYSQRSATRPSSHQDGLFPGRPELQKDWKRDRAAGLARMPTQNVINDEGGWVAEKSLMGLPWRYALGCMDDLGLILRAEIIWCLSGGARVYARTPTGDRPVMLRDLVRAYQPQNVQLWNGERWTQVLGWNRSPDREGALEIELRTGERIGCTPGHRWPTQRGVIRADEIRIGDVIQTARLPEPAEPRHPSALNDDEIGWLIGLYMAEGSRSGKQLQFAGHVQEDARHMRLRHIAQAYDGHAAVYQTSEHGVTCNLSGSVLVGIVDRYIGAGHSARSKRLRHTVWQRSDQFLAAIAEGYLSGDGHYDAKNDRWRLGFTQNDEWAADLRTLAARLGVKLSLRRHDHMFNGRKYPGWRGEWRWTRSAHHNAKQDGEVVAIRASRAREFYDVGVADDPHLFALASGVLTHNSKPNGLPESVTDRVRRSHEQVFHFTRQPRYYSAVDEIREAHTDQSAHAMSRRSRADNRLAAAGAGQTSTANPLGKLPGSVWDIASQPLTVPASLGIDHFAAFPMELPRRIILGWSPPGICTACGEGRRPVVAAVALDMTRPQARRAQRLADQAGLTEDHLQALLSVGISDTGRGAATQDGTGKNTAEVYALAGEARAVLGGYAREYLLRRPTRFDHACACAEPTAPTRPAVVLDPFGGTGTTALVASVNGRHGISVDMSADYCRLATWRTTDPGERARAMQVAKPPAQLPDQDALFDLGEAL